MAINLNQGADATIAAAAAKAGAAGIPADLSTTFQGMATGYQLGMTKLGAGLAKAAKVAAEQGAKLVKKAVDNAKLPPVEDLEMMNENFSGTLLDDVANLKEERKGMFKFWDKKDDPDTDVDEGRMSWKDYKKSKKIIQDEVASHQVGMQTIVAGLTDGTIDTGSSNAFNLVMAEAMMDEDGEIKEGPHAGSYAKHVKLDDGKYAWKLFDKNGKEISGINKENNSLEYQDGSDRITAFAAGQAGDLADAAEATELLKGDEYKDFDATITKPENIVEGVFNTEVEEMQKKLKAAGYDLGKEDVDGKWGTDTKKAWTDYSSKVGLYNDLAAKTEGYTPGVSVLPEGFEGLNGKQQYEKLVDIVGNKRHPDFSPHFLRSLAGEERVDQVAALLKKYPSMSPEEATFFVATNAGGKTMGSGKTEWADSDNPDSPQNALIRSYSLGSLTSQLGVAAPELEPRESRTVASSDLASMLVPIDNEIKAAWQSHEIDVLTSAAEGGGLRSNELRNNLMDSLKTSDQTAFMMGTRLGNHDESYAEALSMPGGITTEMWLTINDLFGTDMADLDTNDTPGLDAGDFENNLKNFSILKEAMLDPENYDAKQIFVDWYAQDIEKNHEAILNQWQTAQDDATKTEEEKEEEIKAEKSFTDLHGVGPNIAFTYKHGGGTVTNSEAVQTAGMFNNIVDGTHSQNSFMFAGFEYKYDPILKKWSRLEWNPTTEKNETKTYNKTEDVLGGGGLGWSGTPWLMKIINSAMAPSGAVPPTVDNSWGT